MVTFVHDNNRIAKPFLSPIPTVLLYAIIIHKLLKMFVLLLCQVLSCTTIC